MRLPVVVQARMVLNAAFDMLIGLVPILGDLADVGVEGEPENLALLERHARPGVSPARGDYVFVWVLPGDPRADRDHAVVLIGAVAVVAVRVCV